MITVKMPTFQQDNSMSTELGRSYSLPMMRKWILNPAPVIEESDLNLMVTDFASIVKGWSADSFR